MNTPTREDRGRLAPDVAGDEIPTPPAEYQPEGNADDQRRELQHGCLPATVAET